MLANMYVEIVILESSSLGVEKVWIINGGDARSMSWRVWVLVRPREVVAELQVQQQEGLKIASTSTSDIPTGIICMHRLPSIKNPLETTL